MTRRALRELAATPSMPATAAGGTLCAWRISGARGIMRSSTLATSLKFVLLAASAVLVGACHRGVSKDDIVQAANIPSSFDVTLYSAKDTQFDMDGAPLTAEDLKSALRYRQEEKLPTATVVLKRGEKDKIKKEHVVALARLAYTMKFRAYWDDDGQISEIRAQLKEGESDTAPPPSAPKKPEKPAGGGYQ